MFLIGLKQWGEIYQRKTMLIGAKKMHSYRMSDACIDMSSDEKDLRILISYKLSIS